VAVVVSVAVQVGVKVNVGVAVAEGVREGVKVVVNEGVNDAVAVGGTQPMGRQAGWVPVLGSGTEALDHSVTSVPL